MIIHAVAVHPALATANSFMVPVCRVPRKGPDTTLQVSPEDLHHEKKTLQDSQATELRLTDSAMRKWVAPSCLIPSSDLGSVSYGPSEGRHQVSDKNPNPLDADDGFTPRCQRSTVAAVASPDTFAIPE